MGLPLLPRVHQLLWRVGQWYHRCLPIPWRWRGVSYDPKTKGAGETCYRWWAGCCCTFRFWAAEGGAWEEGTLWDGFTFKISGLCWGDGLPLSESDLYEAGQVLVSSWSKLLVTILSCCAHRTRTARSTWLQGLGLRQTSNWQRIIYPLRPTLADSSQQVSVSYTWHTTHIKCRCIVWYIYISPRQDGSSVKYSRTASFEGSYTASLNTNLGAWLEDNQTWSDPTRVRGRNAHHQFLACSISSSHFKVKCSDSTWSLVRPLHR